MSAQARQIATGLRAVAMGLESALEEGRDANWVTIDANNLGCLIEDIRVCADDVDDLP